MDEIYAGVDLGGTTVKCVFAGADGVIRHEDSIPTRSNEGPNSVLERIGQLINSMAQKSGRKPAAIGMGVPGLVDVAAGITRFLPNFPTKWRDVPAADILGKIAAAPVRLLNDVRTATLGELTFGHGTSVDTMVFLALGTGVGGGVVVDGKLRLGPLGAAGELGHQTIDPDGPPCGCGNRGCLETLCSGPALAAEGVRLIKSGTAPKLFELTGGDADKLTPREMARAAEAGDESVQIAINRAAHALGIGIANIVVALHPELVVLGGGVAEMGPILFDPVRQVVNDRVRMIPADSVQIKKSLVGERAGVLGAIALAAQSVFGKALCRIVDGPR